MCDAQRCAIRPVVRCRCYDGAVCHQERGLVSSTRRHHGDRADQTGWRRAGWRGTVGRIGCRCAEIVFSGIGERLEDLEVFRPERLVSRMLGMGDILMLVERAEAAVTRDSAARLEQRVRQEQFTVDHLREQLDTIRRMGPLD